MRVKEVLCLYPRRRWRCMLSVNLFPVQTTTVIICAVLSRVLKVEKVGQAQMMDAKKTQRETRK